MHAAVRDRPHALQERGAPLEQFGPGGAQRGVRGGQVDELVAGDDRRPDAVDGVEGREPHALAHFAALVDPWITTFSSLPASAGGRSVR